ncbi:hypothetical protein BASA81_003924 [Batrachochytrium salamandrivorans]|nr:hypothetical protein BASA81_003924 [Batrachochytrium salamandrivorans]
MSFNRGYYELGNLPSRQVAQRDLPNQTRLKLRRQQQSGESVEGKLERLKKELEEKRLSLSVPVAGGEEEVAAAAVGVSGSAAEFDDADDEELIQPPKEGKEEVVTGKEAESELDQELEREMERVKREKRQKVQEEEEEAERTRGGGLFSHNPLVPSSSTTTTTGLVRRWDDDVIFRNQARGELDLSKEKRLINDTTKSDTHRQFLKRHIL